MKLIKRNGAEVVFDREKIAAAVLKANLAVDEKYRITDVSQYFPDKIELIVDKLWILQDGGSMKLTRYNKKIKRRGFCRGKSLLRFTRSQTDSHEPAAASAHHDPACRSCCERCCSL